MKIVSIVNLERCDKETHDCDFCESHKHKHRFEKPDECTICTDPISSETETPLECGHWIHKHCIVPTNLHKCPICNNKMTEQETEYVFGTDHKEQNNYNDGNSIYINFATLQEDESESTNDTFLGNGARNSLYNWSDDSIEQLNSVMNDMNDADMQALNNSVNVHGINSRLFTTMNIVRFERESHMEEIEEFWFEIIESTLRMFNNEMRQHGKRFTRTDEDMKELLFDKFSEYPRSNEMIIVLDNLMRCETENVNDLIKNVSSLIQSKLRAISSNYIQV